ncbi:MAG: sugar transferase [Anaerolineae bacterium]|jgi:exopolysaccharide biosynthesis polyprenyl glycosylphosphotransferase|nr:sugar transferase [Anaerolineae bacterium]
MQTKAADVIFSPQSRRKGLQLRLAERRFIVIAGDALAVVIAVMIALAIWAWVDQSQFDLAFLLPQSVWFIMLPILWMILASANDFYDLNIVFNRSPTLQRLFLITGQTAIVYLIVFFLSPREALPRLFIVYYAIASLVLVTIWRLVNPILLGRVLEPRQILIVGTGSTAQEIIQAIQTQQHKSLEIRGVIGPRDEVGQLIGDVPIIGAGTDLMNFVQRDRIHELVITSTHRLSDEDFKAVMDAYELGVSLVPMPILYEAMTGRVPVEHIKDNWSVVLPTQESTLLNPYKAIKRLVEILLSGIGMIIFLFLLPLIALVIRLDSPGPIFYTQERVGLGGRVFQIIKFRTMVQNAEAKTGAVFSQQGDPRVTRFGRIMRKTRLDEIPQLINVLRGDMSLIGPRPERPEHVKRLTEKIPFYRTRLTIRPGLTGWAQVRYGYGSTDEDALVKLQYDLYYIRHQSLLLDLNILIRTVGKVLKMSGI